MSRYLGMWDDSDRLAWMSEEFDPDDMPEEYRRCRMQGCDATRVDYAEGGKGLCPEHQQGYQQRQADAVKAGHLERRHRGVWGSYRMTAEEYDRMHMAQDGRCALCGERPSDAMWDTLHVDHDHACCPSPPTCGECTRALLCVRCNTGLGHFQDDTTRLRAAADYVDRHRESQGIPKDVLAEAHAEALLWEEWRNGSDAMRIQAWADYLDRHQLTPPVAVPPPAPPSAVASGCSPLRPDGRLPRPVVMGLKAWLLKNPGATRWDLTHRGPFSPASLDGALRELGIELPW